MTEHCGQGDTLDANNDKNDSIAASVFADTFVQLTITIYQFNHYIYKYWDGSAVWILHKKSFLGKSHIFDSDEVW